MKSLKCNLSSISRLDLLPKCFHLSVEWWKYLDVRDNNRQFNQNTPHFFFKNFKKEIGGTTDHCSQLQNKYQTRISLFQKKWPPIQPYINQLLTFRAKPQQMAILQLSTILLIMSTGKCAQGDDCSKNGLFPGIADDRGALSWGKTVTIYDMLPSTCGAGVRCRTSCFNNSFIGNFIEVRKVSGLRSVLCANLGAALNVLVQVF